METETKKIAVACFIGGVICSATALLFSPRFWWFGLITGVAGGYVGYEFREFLKAIPIAFRNAWDNNYPKCELVIKEIKKWFSKSHPFIYTSFVLIIPFFTLDIYQNILWYIDLFNSSGLLYKILAIPIFFIFSVFDFVITIFPIIGILYILSVMGSRLGDSSFWQPFEFPFLNLKEKDVFLEEIKSECNEFCFSLCSKKCEQEYVKRKPEKYRQKLLKKGYKEKELSYLNLLRWTLLGIGVIIYFFVWLLWKYIAIGIWKALCLFGSFIYYLFKEVHSNKRLLCSIDGTLGGVFSYLLLVSSAKSPSEQIVLILFGGILGVAFGILNWEIVSKRILKVAS
jgi:hypothetical protein